jgi:hydroxypyruvate reductase
VIDGAPHDIASGPTVSDPTTLAEAREALSQWIPDRVASIAPHMTESLKAGPGSPRLRAREIAGPSGLSHAIGRHLGDCGYRVFIDPPETGDVASTAARRIARAASLAPGDAVIVASEPTISLPRDRGRGGRAGRVALLALRELPSDVGLLCAASDGADGSSEHAGAVVFRSSQAATSDTLLDRALAAFDDASAHEAMGTSFDLPAGNNLTDVHVIARAPMDR